MHLPVHIGIEKRRRKSCKSVISHCCTKLNKLARNQKKVCEWRGHEASWAYFAGSLVSGRCDPGPGSKKGGATGEYRKPDASTDRSFRRCHRSERYLVQDRSTGHP